MLVTKVSQSILCFIQEKFKTGLLHSAEEFKKTVSNIAEDFDSKGPFTDAVPIAEAMEFITNMRSQLDQLKLQEANIRKGLNIFKIDQPPSHIIVGLDKVYPHLGHPSVITMDSRFCTDSSLLGVSMH